MTERSQQESLHPVSPKRLWFGFTGGAAAWVLAGLLNVLFAWQSCMGGEAGSFVFTQTGIRILLGVITCLLLALALAAGVISFQNWRALSEQREFSDAEGRGRCEFMAMFGVFVSASLGAGIIWFALPIYIVRMCVRAH
jgi:hypothetical protein